MEAWRFGFDLPPAYKFDPTDADIVAHYLLPRAAGIRDPPYAHALIDDGDPCSCPPWELLRRHGHAGSDQAFFLGPGPPTPSSSSLNGGRACRAVRGGPGGGVAGVWRGQKGEEADLVVSRGGGGGEMRLRFKRYNLTYYAAGERAASGWVMYEYHILKPKLRPGAVLWRVRITDRAKKERKKKKQAAAAAKRAAPPGQDRPGPSECLVGDRAAGNAAAAAKKDARGPYRAAGSAAAVASDDGGGTASGSARSDVVRRCDHGDNGGVGETAGGGYYTDLLNYGEGDGGYGFLPAKIQC
ncbi:unnamed protein product [Urochloa humidicola]